MFTSTTENAGLSYPERNVYINSSTYRHLPYLILLVGALSDSSDFDLYKLGDEQNDHISSTDAVVPPSHSSSDQFLKNGLNDIMYHKIQNTSDSSNPDAISRYSLKKSELQNKILSFRHLNENWNGYNALPISDDTINEATYLLHQLSGLPSVFPTGRDSIQFEYENFETENYLEIEVFANKHTESYAILGDEEIEASNLAINELNKIINKINGSA